MEDINDTNNVTPTTDVNSEEQSYILIVKEETCDDVQECNLHEEKINGVKHKINISSLATTVRKPRWKIDYERYKKKTYICGLNLCTKAFSRFCDLIQHDRLEHEDVVMDTSCNICGKMFVNDSRLDIHIASYHGERKYTCDVCGGKFLTKSTLRAHLIKHKGQWVCSECGLRANSNISLLDHKRKHSGDRPFICDTCGCSCTTKAALNSHKMQHAKVLPFKCDVCGYRALNRSSMRNHKATHSLKRECICETCGKMFKIKSELDQHRKTHDPHKKHVCEICKLCFVRKTKLNLHMRVHTGDKPFTCDVCTKRFARRDGLSEHMRTHTEDKKYTCNICVKRFSLSRSLKQHKCAYVMGVLTTCVKQPIPSTEISDDQIGIKSQNVVR